MNFVKNNLANALTLGNLFFGTIGVIHVIADNYRAAAFCIILSLLFDFFDGFIARALKSDSNLGAQLDSLADMVSFGVLPGIAMYKMLEPFGTEIGEMHFPFELKYFGLLISVFSGLRLAIFNVDEEQTYYFKGLNTPSNTVLLFGLMYSFQETGRYRFIFDNPLYLLILSFLSCWLLVSPIKMIALKFKSMLLKDNYPKIILLIGAFTLLSLMGIAGVPLVIVFYMLTSLAFQKQL